MQRLSHRKNFVNCFFFSFQRKLRTFEKKQDSMQKSMDTDAIEEAMDFTLRQAEDDDHSKNVSSIATEEQMQENNNNKEEVGTFNQETTVRRTDGLFMLPNDHPDYSSLIRLQLENQVISIISIIFKLLYGISLSGIIKLEATTSSKNQYGEGGVCKNEKIAG